MLIVGERVNREITNFHLLHWRATKVVKVVVCARTRILLLTSIIFLPSFAAAASFDVGKFYFGSQTRIMLPTLTPSFHVP